MPPKRFLDRLVNDSHPAPTDFAKNPEIAELFDRRKHGPPSRSTVQPLSDQVPLGGLDLFHHQQRWEQFQNQRGQLGITFDILGQCRPLAQPVSRNKFLRQNVQRVTVCRTVTCGHVVVLSISRGTVVVKRRQLVQRHTIRDQEIPISLSGDTGVDWRIQRMRSTTETRLGAPSRSRGSPCSSSS